MEWKIHTSPNEAHFLLYEHTLLLGAYFLCVGIYVHPLNNVQLQYLDDPKRAVKLEAAHVFSIISHS